MRGISDFQLGGGGREGEGSGGPPLYLVNPWISGSFGTVLNRSEYLYTRVLPSHLFCCCRRRRRRLPGVLNLPWICQRYLLDYPVLINSSGFIFIFATPRSRANRAASGQDRSFLRAEAGRGMTVANREGGGRRRSYRRNESSTPGTL